MLKARRNATTPIGNCEDNWLVRVAIGAHVQTWLCLSLFWQQMNVYWAIPIRYKSIIVLSRILTVSIG